MPKMTLFFQSEDRKINPQVSLYLLSQVQKHTLVLLRLTMSRIATIHTVWAKCIWSSDKIWCPTVIGIPNHPLPASRPLPGRCHSEWRPVGVHRADRTERSQEFSEYICPLAFSFGSLFNR